MIFEENIMVNYMIIDVFRLELVILLFATLDYLELGFAAKLAASQI